jgi:hypothetical protein
MRGVSTFFAYAAPEIGSVQILREREQGPGLLEHCCIAFRNFMLTATIRNHVLDSQQPTSLPRTPDQRLPPHRNRQT